MTSAESGPRHGARTKARKRAVDILFESDLRERDLSETLDERTHDADPPVREYTSQIVRGVVDHQQAIDQRIAERLANGWVLERLPRVDRAIARMATYEIDYAALDPAIVISEAKTLADELSTEESASYLHGVLAAIADSADRR